jgi:hypothetical protein
MKQQVILSYVYPAGKEIDSKLGQGAKLPVLVCTEGPLCDNAMTFNGHKPGAAHVNEWKKQFSKGARNAIKIRRIEMVVRWLGPTKKLQSK